MNQFATPVLSKQNSLPIQANQRPGGQPPPRLQQQKSTIPGDNIGPPPPRLYTGQVRTSVPKPTSANPIHQRLAAVVNPIGAREEFDVRGLEAILNDPASSQHNFYDPTRNHLHNDQSLLPELAHVQHVIKQKDEPKSDSDSDEERVPQQEEPKKQEEQKQALKVEKVKDMKISLAEDTNSPQRMLHPQALEGQKTESPLQLQEMSSLTSLEGLTTDQIKDFVMKYLKSESN